MVSRLYAADILGAGKPVEEESVQENTQKVKKPRKPKQAPAEPTLAPLEEVPEPVAEAPKPVKEKKPRTEKQIAAAQRMVEARRLKKEQEQAKIAEVEAEKVRLEAQLAEKETQRAAKKEEARLRRLEKKTASTTPTDGASGEETNKKVKKQRTEDDHPSWMPHLIAEVKSALDTTKSKRQIATESKTEAQKKWEDPLVRSRVADVQNTTANKIFSSIFPGRRL